MRKPLHTASNLRAAFLHCRVNNDLGEVERPAIVRPRASCGVGASEDALTGAPGVSDDSRRKGASKERPCWGLFRRRLVRSQFVRGFAAVGIRRCEPWKTEETTAGTVQVADIAAGMAGSNAQEPVTITNFGDVYLIFKSDEELLAIKNP